MLIPRGRPLALNLALQGGGAHGAFTWGVLDRIVEDGRFRYEGISGTSAGAINAVLFASGWLKDGPAGAKAALEAFWHEVTALAEPLHRSGFASVVTGPGAQLVSPYQINPFDFNPLRELLERLVDFERLRAERALSLLIATTALRTGSLRLFTNRDLSAKVVLASACLPWLHQAVEIDGEPHWDGGYVSNPPLVPLIERCPAPDVLLIRINPRRRHRLPTSAGDIRNRIGEIVFDQPLARELAQLDARRGTLAGFTAARRRIARHRLHVIDGGDQLAELDSGSKLIPVRDTLTEIRALGRQAASIWLENGTDARRSEPEPSTMEPAA